MPVSFPPRRFHRPDAARAEASGQRDFRSLRAGRVNDRLWEHHSAVGRITADVIRKHLRVHGADCCFCGPPGFMAAMETTLEELRIPIEHRHSGVVGPEPSFATGELPQGRAV